MPAKKAPTKAATLNTAIPRGVVSQGRGISPSPTSPSKNPWNASMTADGRWSPFPAYAAVVSRNASPSRVTPTLPEASTAAAIPANHPLPQTPVLRPVHADGDIPHLDLEQTPVIPAAGEPAANRPENAGTTPAIEPPAPMSSPGSPLALAARRKKDKGKKKAAPKRAHEAATSSIGMGPPPSTAAQETRVVSDARKRRRVTGDNGDEGSIGDPARVQPSPSTVRRLEEMAEAERVADSETAMNVEPPEGDDVRPSASHFIYYNGIDASLITENHRPHPAPLPPRTPFRAPAGPSHTGPRRDAAPHMDVRNGDTLEPWIPQARPYPPPDALTQQNEPSGNRVAPARPHTSTARTRPANASRPATRQHAGGPRAVSHVANPPRVDSPFAAQQRQRTPMAERIFPPPTRAHDVFWLPNTPHPPQQPPRTPAPLFPQPLEPVFWRTPLTRTAFEPERAIGRPLSPGDPRALFHHPAEVVFPPYVPLPPPPARHNATPGPARIPVAAPAPRRPPTFEPQDVVMEEAHVLPPFAQNYEPPPMPIFDVRAGPPYHDQRPVSENRNHGPQPILVGPRAPINLNSLPMTLSDETPAPPGGWRIIAGGFDPFWKVEGVSRTQIDDWNARNQPAVFLTMPQRSTLDAGGYECRLAMERTLRRLGIPQPEIEFPDPENEKKADNKPPHWCVAFGPTAEQCRQLVAKRWVSTSDATFGIVEYSFDTSHFVGFWGGLEYFDDMSLEGMRAAFRKALDRLLAEGNLRDIIQHDIDTMGRWRGQTVDYAFAYIRESVYVDLLECFGPQRRPNTLVRLYCEPPTSTLTEWVDFRRDLQACRLSRPGAKSPMPVDMKVRCSYCHTVDHPTGLCYLPGVKHWHGPEPDKSSDEPTAVKHQPQKSRNNTSSDRGGARGRGGYNADRGRRGRSY
ncbi:uncharacterized protein B0H18DRAFT_959929 [Fomitopsis serialis]|uniref:uncharacterized protein n=1 Tax=Fomitopsis serialis TaxID=139415 RepID=UPI002008AF1F|nr:uncharacterized protein B0H18DRAFT_959929 [Neoantrodia serialis]KAH9914294.1 hypothetical protein B0H18DRAFT_959929 [Neoantrodia serialis]